MQYITYQTEIFIHYTMYSFIAIGFAFSDNLLNFYCIILLIIWAVKFTDIFTKALDQLMTKYKL